jgi:hypothetical protein
MLYNIKSSSKKVLLIIAFMATALVGKVFAQTQKSYTSILRSDVHYYSSSTLAKDIKAGKLKLSNNVTELFWINRTLDRWNAALIDGDVRKPGDTEIFQLSSSFTDLQDARDYIADILSNHCRDFDATFKKGECRIGRAEEGRMNTITVDLDRDARAGEKITMLVPSSFTGKVSKSDGNYPLIDGFSLYCLNDTEKVKVKKSDPVQSIVKVKEDKPSILSPGNEVTYKGIADNTTATTTTTGTGNTYNTYNTVNTPPPPPVDKHPNRGIWAGIGVGVLGTAINFAMNLFMMKQMQRQTVPTITPPAPIYVYQAPPVTPTSTGTPIQGNTGTVDYTPIQGNTGNVGYNPIQGATGNTVNYNPVQGVTNGVVAYDPVQGATGQKWVYDPIQGWVFR